MNFLTKKAPVAYAFCTNKRNRVVDLSVYMAYLGVRVCVCVCVCQKSLRIARCHSESNFKQQHHKKVTKLGEVYTYNCLNNSIIVFSPLVQIEFNLSISVASFVRSFFLLSRLSAASKFLYYK